MRDKRGATMLKNELSAGFKLALLHEALRIVRELAVAAGTDRSAIETLLADHAVLLTQDIANDVCADPSLDWLGP